MACISLLKDNKESSIKFTEGSEGSEEKYFTHKLQNTEVLTLKKSKMAAKQQNQNFLKVIRNQIRIFGGVLCFSNVF